ncbi:tetratricopeptide repeat protein [bacterium]|nr:tetratricopeptide repeat protein [bacterium]
MHLLQSSTKRADSFTATLRALSPNLLILWWKTWKSLPIISWLRAAGHFRSGNFGSAIDFYRHGLARHPEHRAADYARLDFCYCLYRIGHLAEAEKELRILVEKEVRIRDVYLLLAEIELLLGRKTDAVLTIARCLKVFPHDVRTNYLYTRALLACGGPAKHIAILRERLYALRAKIDVRDTQAALLETAIASYELQHGQKEQGEKLLSRVLAGEDFPYEALLLKAEWYLDSGRFPQARKLAERAMSIDPNHPEPPALLAQSYLRDERIYEPSWAVALAETACKLSFWQNPIYLELLVDALERSGDHDSAELFRERASRYTTRDFHAEKVQAA